MYVLSGLLGTLPSRSCEVQGRKNNILKKITRQDKIRRRKIKNHTLESRMKGMYWLQLKIRHKKCITGSISKYCFLISNEISLTGKKGSQRHARKRQDVHAAV